MKILINKFTQSMMHFLITVFNQKFFWLRMINDKPNKLQGNQQCQKTFQKTGSREIKYYYELPNYIKGIYEIIFSKIKIVRGGEE